MDTWVLMGDTKFAISKSACVTLWRRVRRGHKRDPSFSYGTVDRYVHFSWFEHNAHFPLDVYWQYSYKHPWNNFASFFPFLWYIKLGKLRHIHDRWGRRLFLQWIYHLWSLIKKIACVSVVKVWANSVRGPNPKWPPGIILNNRTGRSKVTICPRNYCDTFCVPNLGIINPFVTPF